MVAVNLGEWPSIGPWAEPTPRDAPILVGALLSSFELRIVGGGFGAIERFGPHGCLRQEFAVNTMAIMVNRSGQAFRQSLKNASTVDGAPVDKRASAPERTRPVWIDRFRVDLETWEVTVDNQQVRLPEKPFRVLFALVERPGEVVTRAELQDRLWPDGTVVDFDNNLNSAVATLRTVFSESAKTPRIIQTLPRLGYRLIGEVRFDGPLTEDEFVPKKPGWFDGRDARPLRSRWFLAAGATLVALFASGVAVARFASTERPSGTTRPGSAAPTTAAEIEKPLDPAVQEVWRRGLYLEARSSGGDLELAAKAFRDTLREEPGFAPAHVKLAETLARMSFERGADLREGLALARFSANRALLLDSSSATALRIRSLANLHLDWDFLAAWQDLELALRLAPHDPEVYLTAATLLSATGENNAAVLAAKRAVDLDPASALFKADLTYFLVAAGRDREAMTVAEDLLRLEPASRSALFFRMLAAERLGDYGQSLRNALRIMELGGASAEEIEALRQGEPSASLVRFRRWHLERAQHSDLAAFHIAARHASLNHRDEALALLEQAVEQREPWMVYLQGYSQFDGLRGDLRFRRLAALVGNHRPDRNDVKELVTVLESRL